jgi:hypothetical protein
VTEARRLVAARLSNPRRERRPRGGNRGRAPSPWPHASARRSGASRLALDARSSRCVSDHRCAFAPMDSAPFASRAESEAPPSSRRKVRAMAVGRARVSRRRRDRPTDSPRPSTRDRPAVPHDAIFSVFTGDAALARSDHLQTSRETAAKVLLGAALVVSELAARPAVDRIVMLWKEPRHKGTLSYESIARFIAHESGWQNRSQRSLIDEAFATIDASTPCSTSGRACCKSSGGCR